MTAWRGGAPVETPWADKTPEVGALTDGDIRRLHSATGSTSGRHRTTDDVLSLIAVVMK
jgi:hypothetical protein